MSKQPGCCYASLPVRSILEEGMLCIAGADQVGDQVEDFVFGHAGKQIGGHGGRFGNDQFINRLAINVDPFIRIGEVGIQSHVISTQVDDDTGVDFAVFCHN